MKATWVTWNWACGGVVLGLLLALVVFAPAAWLAHLMANASGQQLLLADARGTVWRGSARVVLTGGPGSRNAAALPGRLTWRWGLKNGEIEFRARQECCLNDELKLRLLPSIGRLKITLVPTAGPVGRWPAAWLVGLGAPWNTLQPGGSLRLASPGFSLEAVQGRWIFDGRAELAIEQATSRLVPLEALGSWKLVVDGEPGGGENARFVLSTLQGPLMLSGEGLWAGAKLRFRGEARAAPGAENALNNLLNIIGRRQGALSVLSIG